MPVLSPVRLLEVELEIFSRRGGLYRFLKAAWPHVEAQAYVDGWHVEETCAHLEAVSRGELKRLIVNIPPGFAKSLMLGVFWPAWDWGILAPWRKYMYASFDATLSQRDALRTKDLVASDWFQSRFGLKAPKDLLEKRESAPLYILSDAHGKQNTATIYWTSGGGLRFSTSVAGRSTGWHSHIQVVDDPTKPKDVQGGGKKARTALTKTYDWWANTMSSRHADPDDFSRVIVMQRLHARDLAGLMEKTGDYTVLRLPMRFKRLAASHTPWGGDRRSEEGELLWPERFSAEAEAQIRKDMGPAVAAAQLDQTPSPDGGSIYKRPWFSKTWTKIPAGCQWMQSWDFSFSDEDESDYVVGQVWAWKGGEFYLVDQVRDRMDLVDAVEAVRNMSAKWPKARRKVLEKKANGAAVQSTLRKKHKLPGLVFYNPQDSKEGRANAVSGYWEAGDIYLPENAPWKAEFIQEHIDFPKGENDDQVDASNQALLNMTGKGVSVASAMDNV